MPALKDIGTLANRIGVSCLSQSPLWHQDISTIVPAQIYAFVTKMKMNGRLDEGESAIEIALREVHQAVARNEIAVPPMLSYYRPTRIYLTAGELKNGLIYLGGARATATLFALETGMDALDVTRLTHKRLAGFRRVHPMSALAEECLRITPRHLSCPYVFWRETDDGMTLPLFGMDAAIFDAFGLVWAELAQGYADLILIDEDADRESIECWLNR